MKKTFILLIAAALALSCASIAISKCSHDKTKKVCGTIEGPIGMGEAPETARKATENTKVDSRYENIMTDEESKVSVWSLMRTDDNTSAEGFGIIVEKNGVKTAFPDIRHGNNPSAHYNAATETLWITGADMEGTGILVERPYIINFDTDNHAVITATIDPYDMQQAVCQHAGYTIDGENITLYNDNDSIYTATNTISDMGGFDDDALWVGEQISYDISGDDIVVNITPGVNFIVGKVLLYDDMPTISARVVFGEEKPFSLTDVAIVEESEGEE